MIVAVAYSELHPRVVPAIDRQGYQPRLREMTTHDAYPRFIEEMFSLGEDVCFIEHDVESRTGALQSYEECPRPWCFHAYNFSVPFDECALDFAPLGHTRFRELAPVLEGGLFRDPEFFKWWVGRDVPLSRALQAHGHQPHRHEGYVAHHHDYALHPHRDLLAIEEMEKA